jgi:hypothetical protein
MERGGVSVAVDYINLDIALTSFFPLLESFLIIFFILLKD